MKSIFNSLGSNYSLSFALTALFQIVNPFDQSSVVRLSDFLNKKYNGESYTFYKGRDAIEFSLRTFGIGKGNAVLTQAFSCWAVEEGITRSGATPIFVDIEKGNINPSLETIKSAYKKTANIKAVLLQHTFGFPSTVSEIRKWCDEKNLILIEDLAHALGAKDSKRVEVGTFADVVVLSFGRDKIVDAVSGGACVIKSKHKSVRGNITEIKKTVSYKYVLKGLTYPFFTWKIRKTYLFGGKLLHFALNLVGLLSSPIQSPTNRMRALPPSHASLILNQLYKHEASIDHQRKMAEVYKSIINSKYQLGTLDISNSANLRFPLVISDPRQLIDCMKRNNIFLADRWYKSPVDCGKMKNLSSYKKGSCPNAENLSQKIINLPTHINVSQKNAKRVAREVNLCLKKIN